MQTLRKAFDILNFLAKEKRDMRLSEIAEALNINKSSVHKMLSVMCEYEYVRQNSDSGKYGLGGKYVKIGNTLLRNINVRREAHPYMEKLSKETDETINLMVLHGKKGMYAEIIESPLMARTFQMVGTIEYLHACALGKVLLAYMPPSEVDKIVASVGLPARTKHTITDYEELKIHLQEIKEKGYAIDREEVCLGVVCIAAPIFDHKGNVIASLSISAPTVRMSEVLIYKYVDLLKSTTQDLSNVLNFSH